MGDGVALILRMLSISNGMLGSHKEGISQVKKHWRFTNGLVTRWNGSARCLEDQLIRVPSIPTNSYRTKAKNMRSVCLIAPLVPYTVSRAGERRPFTISRPPSESHPLSTSGTITYFGLTSPWRNFSSLVRRCTCSDSTSQATRPQ